MEENEQLLKLQELFSARYKRPFTSEEIQKHCVAVIYNGIVSQGWTLKGIKLKKN